jgi:hypothetical protein
VLTKKRSERKNLLKRKLAAEASEKSFVLDLVLLCFVYLGSKRWKSWRDLRESRKGWQEIERSHNFLLINVDFFW